MATVVIPHSRTPNLLAGLNSQWHYKALTFYLIVVASHWMEHGVQAVQIYILGRPPAQALGLLGSSFPALVSSEALHYGYAMFMIAGLALLRPAFTDSAKKWWTAALLIQVWHFFEHLLLLAQVVVGANLLDKAKPVSIIQLVIPRVELHLLYNMLVLLPLLVAVALHWFPKTAGKTKDAAAEADHRACSCARRTPVA